MPIKYIMNKCLFSALFLIICGFAFAKDSTVANISDDSSLRIALSKSLFVDTPSDVLLQKSTIQTLNSGDKVQVRVERGRSGTDEFSIIIARFDNGSFSGWAQGSFIYTRRISDGKPVRVRVFLRSDPYTYIQFRANSETRTNMDVVLYDAFVARSLPVPYSFDRLLVTQLQDILQNVKFPHKYFEPDPDDYRDTRMLIREVRKNIKGLEFSDDGAINQDGEYVFINDLRHQDKNAGLNCSGFAKWFVDGLLKPVTGKRLSIESLKKPFGDRGSNFTESFERIRDPYFGLDWIKNLAAAAGTAIKSPVFSSDAEIEVRNAPFAAMLVRNGRNSSVQSYPGYLPEAGFDFKAIQALLYTLAIDEPGYIFLGAINNIGGRPPMRAYFHIAVLIPYFDENTVFHIAVFESAEETSFNRFRTRYPSHHINLCRVPVLIQFNP